MWSRVGAALVLWAALVSDARAQAGQVAPFGGWQFGGDLYEEITATPLDIDGAPVVGVTIDVFTGHWSSVTIFYSHQEARLDVPLSAGPTRRLRLSVDHWHAGGTLEAGSGRIRPFYSGSLGLTRFGGGGENEIRFSIAGGGGVKLMPWRHVGARADGRVFVVFVDGDATSGICTPGLCAIGVDVAAVWQVQLTAGVVVSF